MMNLFKSKKVTRLALAGILSMTLLSACEYDYVVEPEPEPITTDLKFSTDIIPIFNESCNSSSCHGEGAISPDLSPENAFNSLQNGMIDAENPANSLIYTSMHSGSMKTFTKPGQAEKVLAWIEQGAKNN